MRGLKIAGRILSGALTAVLALLLACNVYIIGARQFAGISHPTVFGWSWAVVISGSMEPQIGIYDLVVIHGQDTYEPGEVISFRSGDSIVTHRIVEKTADGYITRGDANNTQDQYPVREEQVVGQVVLVIPQVGIISDYLRTPLGMLIIVLAGFLLIEIPYRLDRSKEEEKEAAK